MVLAGAPTRADQPPLILVLEPSDTAPMVRAGELAEALDLGLGDLGIRARSGSGVPAGATADRLRAATTMGRAARALAVVWTEDAGTTGQIVVHVLDLRAGRSVAEVLRVRSGPPGEASETAREIALKVRLLLRVALVERAEESDEVRSLVAPVLAPGTPRRTVVQAELDWALAFGASHLRHGPGASIAVLFARRFDAALSLVFLRAAEVELASGTAFTSDTAFGLELGTRFPLPPAALRLAALGRLHWIASTGSTRDGRHGASDAAIPELGTSVTLRVRLVRSVGLGLSVSAGALLGRQRMLLRGEEAFDLGWLVLEARLGLLIPPE